MDTLKKDLDHIRADGIDSGALYKRVCKYLSELLSYKATGLTPEEIAKLQTEVDFASLKEIWGETSAKVEFGVPLDCLRELLKAERDGRLVVLPFHVGTPLYEATQGGVKDFVVESFSIYPGDMFIHATIADSSSAMRIFGPEHIAKTVFLTRQEAEAEVERLKGGICP